jgi:hypothetical protein
MAEVTLLQIFGANATQTTTTLTITKADLASVGLTASANNTAESLLVALLLKAMTYLSPTNQETNPDIQITIDPSYPSIVYRNDLNYRQNTYTVALQKPDTGFTIDPDDY